MYGRFKKAESLEPFSVSKSTPKLPPPPPPLSQPSSSASSFASIPPNAPASDSDAPRLTQIGGAQSTWQPPDWAIEPRPGLFYLEVLKDGVVLDQINLQKRRHIFGRQFHTCDFVLDHQSVSRQHAAVVPHKNGSVFVVDLGSAHGTFVANERLTKDSPVELEVGQSLRFAASTRTYVLRKNEAALFTPTPSLAEINLPPPPDPSDEEAVVAYNTLLNRYGISISDISKSTDAAAKSSFKDDNRFQERPAKRIKKTRVAFRDQVGGELIQVVGVSDGADVETQPGPLGLKEGSLVGKYESLVQTTVIPKGKEQSSVKEDIISPKGVTDKLQQVLTKAKNTNTSKGGLFGDLYGDSSVKVGSSWANLSSSSSGGEPPTSNSTVAKAVGSSSASSRSNSLVTDDDDLFGD
ncbi:protein phosphatase 1 regulatory inhibitor subunit PPP1R8 homolog [Silene latifolia]|uniref:protein phosphatase 1 regulatory inhibitor subunit PPP1R8 homolog n=1 Tax=Silene latifolia TaxID=37657 RepID=UPI003D773579